jgi:hypothetical protein
MGVRSGSWAVDPSIDPVTYTFDIAAIVTLRITTGAGETAARQAASAIDAISVMATRDELDLNTDVPPEVVFDVSTVAPRGRPYLVDGVRADGTDAPVSGMESIPEPGVS